jgi:hypothetical protein
MSNPSNLYAEKVFAEHPLALWALDDQADYVTLISENQRNIEDSWNFTGGTVVSGVSSNAPNPPFSSSVSTSILGDVPLSPVGEIELTSPSLLNFTDMNLDLGTFCIGLYFYSSSSLIKSISIGYQYVDPTSSQIVNNFTTFNNPISSSWIFISETFEIPNEDTTFKAYLKVETFEGGATEDDYQIYINGISIGQWSEEFNVSSLGLTPINFPADIDLDTNSKVVVADAYGLAESSGYYLTDKNFLVAKNTSVPLVFGALSVTKLFPNSNNLPSLIVPGQGFLNNSGRHQEYTAEFWARINSDSLTPKRIFGPISSLDGLYVDNGFLTLKIGDGFGSHFVGEWFRPMLIHIRVLKNSASLLVNGEEVVSFDVDMSTIPLPEISSINGSLDWLGFYAYTDVTPFEIDCVSIYSYQVPVTLAKRRWVYGQGVSSSEGIDSSFSGISTFIDFPFADYTANYSYPNFAQWQQGSFDNLVTTSSSITTPIYALPEIYLGSKSRDSFYEDSGLIQSAGNKFVTFRPNNSWSSEHAYFNFNKLNITNTQTQSVYAVFSTTDQIGVTGGLYNEEGEVINAGFYNTVNFESTFDGGVEPVASAEFAQAQTLIKVYNQNNSDHFIIKQQGNEIIYSLNYNGESQTLYTTPEIELGQLFAVGFNLETVSSYFGYEATSFFGNQNSLKMYVGGDENPINTFTGKIYTVGFSTLANYKNISSLYGDNGFVIFDDLSESGATESVSTELINNTASYTLLPTEAYGSFFLDIGVSGYWEDYLPLSYFAQYVKNDIGNEFYDLDFLQFNIGYPSPSNVVELEQQLESWTYDQIDQKYSYPIQKTYREFDSSLLTDWDNYQDAETQTEKVYVYDTENSPVKSYITFQYIEDGANASQESFTRIEKAKQGKLIDLDEHPLWSVTKFEVVDNTIIYPKKSIDFNSLAIVYRVEFNSRSTISKPVALKTLELSSQVFNNNIFNPVGSRFGVNLFPYKKSGIYYDYKSKNPFSIYKGSTPYLYMTRNSGIEVRGKITSLVDRGISIPINSEISDSYQVNAMQIWYRYDESEFPGQPTQLFQISYKGEDIQFYFVANNKLGNRARVFAVNKKTGQNYNGVTYFLNGKNVREPVLTVKEWSTIGLSFSDSLNFDSYIGAVNLNGPGVFNNISYYKSTDLQQTQRTVTRPWLRVKNEGIVNFDWQYWLNNFLWEGMLSISEYDVYGISPENIYKAYTGTNKIIIDDNSGLTVDADKLKVYSAISWSSNTVSAV